jgi:hypothetical protein
MNMANYPHVVYVVLAIIFAIVVSYMVWYNLRLKRRLKQMETGGHHFGTEEGIAAATESEHQAHLKHRH